jgi:tRNA-binding protein
VTIGYDDFERVDVRVGRITRAEPFPEARKPSLKLWIDFGDGIGIRRSSAQLSAKYDPAQLPGRLVLAVTNFAPRQVATFMSEVLVLGVPDENGAVVLVTPDRDVPIGGRLY